MSPGSSTPPSPAGRTRLRRPTLATAPMFIVAVMGFTVALATGLWGACNPDDLDATFVAVEVIGLAVGILALVASFGCFLEADLERAQLRDVVGWVTVRRIAQPEIVTARVRAGIWRWFEVELEDGTRLLLVGSSPAQFPARLLPGSSERDLADLDLIMGEVPPPP